MSVPTPLMSVPTPLEGLIEARARIAAPYSWFKGSWFRGQERSPYGMCWCALGAVREVYGIDNMQPFSDFVYNTYHKAEEALNKAVPLSHGFQEIVSYNDNKDTRKKDILAVFDTAIESLKETA